MLIFQLLLIPIVVLILLGTIVAVGSIGISSPKNALQDDPVTKNVNQPVSCQADPEIYLLPQVHPEEHMESRSGSTSAFIASVKAS